MSRRPEPDSSHGLSSARPRLQRRGGSRTGTGSGRAACAELTLTTRPAHRPHPPLKEPHPRGAGLGLWRRRGAGGPRAREGGSGIDNRQHLWPPRPCWSRGSTPSPRSRQEWARVTSPTGDAASAFLLDIYRLAICGVQGVTLWILSPPSRNSPRLNSFLVPIS